MSETTLVLEIDETYKNKSLDQCLDDLYSKRGSTRQEALSVLVHAFRNRNKLQHKFVENKHVTLLYQCLNSVKRGSTKEISLACHAIGLLALTVGCGDMAHQILEESILPLSQALKSGTELLKISSILDCLAIITFVGGEYPEETERSLQIIWQLVHTKSDSNEVESNRAMAMVTAAISSWSFLLTTVDGCKTNSTSWQESISYFSSLLSKDDRSVRVVASEAIALLFELGGLDKLYMQELKLKILSQVRNLSMEADGRDLGQKDLNSRRNLFQDVLRFLEDGYCPSTSIKIGGDLLSISMWSQLIQLNFLKNFLGGNFVRHMQDNKLLHEVFEFTPKRKQHISSSEPHFFSSEKVTHSFYQPQGNNRKPTMLKRMFKSPNSALNKARSQLLNKQCMLSQEKNNGHYAIGNDED